MFCLSEGATYQILFLLLDFQHPGFNAGNVRTDHVKSTSVLHRVKVPVLHDEFDDLDIPELSQTVDRVEALVLC